MSHTSVESTATSVQCLQIVSEPKFVLCILNRRASKQESAATDTAITWPTPRTFSVKSDSQSLRSGCAKKCDRYQLWRRRGPLVNWTRIEECAIVREKLQCMICAFSLAVLSPPWHAESADTPHQCWHLHSHTHTLSTVTLVGWEVHNILYIKN